MAAYRFSLYSLSDIRLLLYALLPTIAYENFRSALKVASKAQTMLSWKRQRLLQSSVAWASGSHRAKRPIIQCALQEVSRCSRSRLCGCYCSCLGLWQRCCGAATAPNAEADGPALLASMGKGKPVPCVVESVASGSMLRVTVLPSLQQAAVMVAGVQCPSMGRRPAPDAANGAEATPPEPLAREAAHFAAVRFLNRDANMVVWGLSQVGC